MYTPKHFKVSDEDEAFSFIEANAFGQLISHSSGRLCSSHIPFLISPDRTTLLAHIAKQNPQHRELNGQEVLITLQGAHDYVSPSWYSSPGVPTWNYQAAHIYGQCRVFDEPNKLKHTVDQLTNKYEASFASPWVPNFKASMLKGIVGLEITIKEIECKYKLSQNRSLQDQRQVIHELETLGSTDLANAMSSLIAKSGLLKE